MDFLPIIGFVYSIIVSGLALVTVDYPPIYLARPIVFLKSLSCDIYDIQRLQHVTLEGLVNFRKLPEEIRHDGHVILRIDTYSKSSELVNVRFREQFYDLPCTFESHLDYFQYNCEYMPDNELLRFLVSIELYPNVHPADFDRIYSLHYQSNNYTISSEGKRMDFPIYVNNYGVCAGTIPTQASRNDADTSRNQVSKYWLTVVIIVNAIEFF